MQKISVDTSPLGIPLKEVKMGQTFNVIGTTEYYTRVSDDGLNLANHLLVIPCLFLLDHDEGTTPYTVCGMDAQTLVFVHEDTHLIIK